jgi:hypothetical protein
MTELTGSQNSHTSLGTFYFYYPDVSWYPPQDTDDRHWFLRFNVTGSELKGKAWPEGKPEPADWMIEETSSTFSSGWVGVARLGNYKSVYHWTDFYSLGIGGNDALLPVDMWTDEGWDVLHPKGNLSQLGIEVIRSGIPADAKETRLALQVCRQAHPPHQSIVLDDLTGVLSIEPLDAKAAVGGQFVFRIPTTL